MQQKIIQTNPCRISKHSKNETKLLNDILQTQITNNYRLMFDILDDDLDIGYVPTTMNNSRSGSMKKLSKKQTKQPIKQPVNGNKNNKNNDFNDLFDDILDKDDKYINKVTENKSIVPPSKKKIDDFDSYFDEPKSSSLDKTKQITIKQTPAVSSFIKTSTLKIQQSDEIINEDNKFGWNAGRTQQTITNPSKVEQSFVSSRNMKPPLRKKQGNNNMNQSLNLGLTIPQENSTFGSKIKNNQEDDIIRPPPRLMNRRSSIDGKSQKGQQSLMLTLNISKPEPPVTNNLSLQLKKQTKKQQPYRSYTPLVLEEPKVQKKKEQTSPYLKNIITKPIEKIQQKQQPAKKPLQINVDQSITIQKESPNSANYNKMMAADYQKQIEHIKNIFQKQVDFLQQNLDEQITINRQTRDKLMRDSNKMIQDERARSKKINDEEQKRAKEMFEWEKKRIQETYKNQINMLRQSLQYANKGNNYPKSSTNTADVEYIELQLKNQKKILQDRQKILQRRQNEIEERQVEVRRHRKIEEDRLRAEEKRIMEYEAKCKKQMLDEKQLLAKQKQQIAIQIANMELEVIRKQEKTEINLKNNTIDKNSIENERTQMRIMNAQLMSKYKVKMQQLQFQRERIKAIEQQLIKKLRVVQMKARQISSQQTNKTICQRKQNNWIDKKDQPQRAQSVDKRNMNNQSQSNMNFTKDRFHNLQNNTKQKLAIAAKQNKKFDIDNYMMTIQQYNKAKGNI